MHLWMWNEWVENLFDVVGDLLFRCKDLKSPYPEQIGKMQ